MEITLYYTPHTRSLRPRWLLEELGVPYQLHAIDLFGGEGQSDQYKQINPHGAVPALAIDGEIQRESGANCHWLADHFSEKGLAPALTDPDRALYEQWMFYAIGTLEPPLWLIIMHTKILPEAERVDAIVDWAFQRHGINLTILSQELGAKDYLMGDAFTAADILVGSTLLWSPDTLQAFPNLLAYTKRLQEREAYKKATTE